MIEKPARRRAAAQTKYASKRAKRFRPKRVSGPPRRERPAPWKPPTELPPFEPLLPGADVTSVFRAAEHRFRIRGCDGALARERDGKPTLPEMGDAIFWSVWGAWFAEVARGHLTPPEMGDGETRLREAFRAALRKYGTRRLSRDQQLEIFEYLLAEPSEG